MLPFALLLLVAMGILSLFLSSFFRESYLEISTQNLEAETRLVADQIGDLLIQPADLESVDETAQHFSTLINARVTIINPSGQVIGESGTDAEEMENHLNRPEVRAALRGEIGTETRFSETIQTEMLYSAAPIYNNGEIVGVARLAISLEAIDSKLDSIQRTIMTATAVTSALALIMAFVIAFLTIEPLKKLTRDVHHMAEGRSIEISPPSRLDEIGQLQQAFQVMTNALNDQIEELRAERSKLEAVLANMTDGIIIVDPDGMVQLINSAAAKLFKTDEEKALGKSLIEVVRHHQLVEMWRKSAETGKQESVTLEVTPERLFVQGIATPLRQALPEMTLLVFQDLTRVRKLETVRRDFVSNVSHELRTPLASLKALTETLQEGALEDPPAARRFLQRMETEIDNLTQMVHELLELSRIESNRVPYKFRLVVPCDLVGPTAERMRLQAERAGLAFHVDCPADLPLIKADLDRLAQVLINLIHNAIKFTPPGGEISVSAYQENRRIIICVQDTGVGIAPEALTRIFERFYKADRSRSGGGTGLGLSIARHIVEAHGGQIWAESKVNKGSSFYFSIPIP